MADLRDRWAEAILRDDGITDGCARTAWALREFANRTGYTTVGIARLAKRTGRAARTIERHLATLQRLGYLTRTPGAGETTRGGITTRTELRIPAENPPSLRSVLDPPTGGTVPPTDRTESTDRQRQEVPTELCRPNHREPSEPARGRAREGAARAALRLRQCDEAFERMFRERLLSQGEETA